MTPLPPVFSRIACVIVLGFSAVAVRAAAPRIDAGFPGGNIIVDGIEGDTVFLRPDLRDTQGDWFYWAFRVRGSAGWSGDRVCFSWRLKTVGNATGPGRRSEAFLHREVDEALHRIAEGTVE